MKAMIGQRCRWDVGGKELQIVKNAVGENAVGEHALLEDLAVGVFLRRYIAGKV
jgi:hypothetical protein